MKCLAVLLFSVAVASQTVSDRHQKIRNSVETHNFPAAIIELEDLKSSNQNLFELNNYDYLLARLSEKQGEFARANANYQSVVDRNSVLKEYALWHLAEIARSSGNYFLERIYLRELLSNSPESLITQAAKVRIFNSAFESKDFAAASSAILSGIGEIADAGAQSPPGFDDVFGNLNDNSPRTRESLVLLGRSYLNGGKTDLARLVFNKLVDELPNPSQPDDFALSAVREIDRMDVGAAEFGKSVAPLSDKEHLKRATIYQFNRDFDSVRLHYRSLIAQFPNNPNAPISMYQIGRGFAQEGNFSGATEWFERIQSEFHESSVAQDALNQSAAAFARVNKSKEAVARYEKYIGTFPNAENLDRAYLNIVDILRDKGEATNALNWAEKTRERFRDKTPEAVAVFAKARIHMAQTDWHKALSDLDSLRFFGNLGGTNVSGGTEKDELAFLHGFLMEQMNRTDEAIDSYLSIPDGRKSYYGWRANERLQTILKDQKTGDMVRRVFYPLRIRSSQTISAKNAESIKDAAQSAIRLTDVKQTREQLLETIRKCYSFLPEYKNIPHFKLLEFGRREILSEPRKPAENRHRMIADDLLFLGLYDEGTPEFEIGRLTSSGDKEPEKSTNLTDDEKFTLAVYFARGDMANRAAAFIEPVWRKIPDDYQIELLPREQIELLYPVPYRAALLQHSAPRDLDPRFLLSIMRQESRFRADVKSVSAARGLMQFISSTSNQIAVQLGKDDFRQDDLYHPPTAILFGSQYLSNLFHQFTEQPQAVAASYNGGEENMSRWYARSNSNDPDRYVPEILYSQSKDYVFKVMQNYRIYKMLYTEDLEPVEE